MVQGVNKEYIFYKNEYIEKYLKILKKNKEKYNFTIIAYCIMTNHAHFLVYTEDVNAFGRFMQKVNLKYAQMYNKEENRCGVLFRNRYQTEPIYDTKYLINCIKYIHNNPVKANLVSKCEDYPYSSYKDYIYNVGATQSEVMNKIFGMNCNYIELFKQTFEKRFIDIKQEKNEEIEREYLKEGIRAFISNSCYDIAEVFYSRDLLKKLIVFLNENCGFKYVEIREFLGIPRGTMDTLKLR